MNHRQHSFHFKTIRCKEHNTINLLRILLVMNFLATCHELPTAYPLQRQGGYSGSNCYL